MSLSGTDFSIAEDGVDPKSIPVRKTADGTLIPAIGMGTFGSDHTSPRDVADCVRVALSMGYRHLDCASVYGNEAEIGEVLSGVFESGLIDRQEVWITSKLWNDMHGEGDVLLSCARSLKDLQLEYLDLFLVHWPFPNYHPPGCGVDSRSPNARPYIHEEFMRTWRQMERLVDAGLVRHIGTSNMTEAKMRLLLQDCRIRPAVNEMELHPHFQQPRFFDCILSESIVPVGFSPIGSPGRPERDRTPEDTVDIEDPVITAVAERLGMHPAVVCLKWAVQRGQIPIPFSTKRGNLLANLRGVAGPPLSKSEMAAINGVDTDCRLIKGQVFLWKEGRDWQDLWDPEGVVVS